MNATVKPKKIKVFKTHTFKIHNPTDKKISKIKQSFKQNEMAFYKSIRLVKEDAQALIGKDKPTKRDGLFAIKKKVADTVNKLPFSSAIKSGVIEDVSAQASSFIELTDSGQAAGWPEITDREIDYNNALIQMLKAQTVDEMSNARDEMARALKDQSRPISFVRHRKGDGFLLLADDKNRLFVLASLWKANDKRASQIRIDMTNVSTGEMLSTKTSSGMLLPLECSDWHKTALANGTPKTAKLYMRGGELFLAVAIEYLVDKRETTTYLGVDRGIHEVATYAVRDQTGRVLKTGTFDGLVLKQHQKRLENKQKLSQRKGRATVSGWSKYSDSLMHIVCNAIVAIADEYNAQVVIEDLTAIKNNPHHKRPKFRRKSNFSRLLSRQQYGKAETMLTYKLGMVGLPGPRQIRAAGTSITCPCCGNESKDNRLERAVFFCTVCKYKNHADIVGGINIAGKLLWLEATGKQLKSIKSKKAKMPEELYFKNWQADKLALE